MSYSHNHIDLENVETRKGIKSHARAARLLRNFMSWEVMGHDFIKIDHGVSRPFDEFQRS